MKIKFYVLHCDSSLYPCFITSTDDGIRSYLIGQKSSKILPDSRRFYINSYELFIFLNELENSPTYNKAVARNIKSSSTSYVVELIPNKKEFIDYQVGEICKKIFLKLLNSFKLKFILVRILIWEQLEIDHMFSWLSTLGGAFSALGDYFDRQADIAGKISISQMKLAFRLGDPGLISRCLLYFSISLIQKHKFRLAQNIIRGQYEFAKQQKDTRLQKMCLGIWSKLQWTHSITRKPKKAVKTSSCS
jgi:hypothetical protein